MVKNKLEEAYYVFKRIAKANKKTELPELETLRPSDLDKRLRLNSIMPSDLDTREKKLAIIVNTEEETINKV